MYASDGSLHCVVIELRITIDPCGVVRLSYKGSHKMLCRIQLLILMRVTKMRLILNIYLYECNIV